MSLCPKLNFENSALERLKKFLIEEDAVHLVTASSTELFIEPPLIC